MQFYSHRVYLNLEQSRVFEVIYDSNLCFEEGEFLLLLIKQGKYYKRNYFDIIVIKSRRFICISKQTKLFYNFGSQDRDRKNQD